MSRKCTIISNEHGSSLIVVAMFVTAMGLLSMGALQLYTQYTQAKRVNETQERMEYLKDAMLAYFSQHGRFPCPAPMSAAMDSPEYGQEADSPCAVLEAPEDEEEGEESGMLMDGGSRLGLDIPLLLNRNIVEVRSGGGGGGGGSHRSRGGRDRGGHHGWDDGWDGGGHGGNGNHYGWGRGRGHGGGGAGGGEGGSETETPPEDDVIISDGTIITPGAHDRDVRIGNIPTRAMNLPDTMGVDEWGNRFYYAVVEEMTAAGANALDDLGGITIQDLNGNSVSSAPGNIVLLIVSTGGDPRGAMNSSGVVLEDCNVDMPAGENCDADAVFTTSINKIHDNGDETFSHRMIYIGPDFKADESE